MPGPGVTAMMVAAARNRTRLVTSSMASHPNEAGNSVEARAWSALDERATALGERAEGLLGRDGGGELVHVAGVAALPRAPHPVEGRRGGFGPGPAAAGPAGG